MPNALTIDVHLLGCSLEFVCALQTGSSKVAWNSTHRILDLLIRETKATFFCVGLGPSGIRIDLYAAAWSRGGVNGYAPKCYADTNSFAPDEGALRGC
jgi:hypothetical protein